MSDDEYNALEFGKVIATLEAQNRVLAKMQHDIEKLFSMMHAMQQEERNQAKDRNIKPSDWGREILVAILGAVAYFFFDYFIHGGK